MALGPVGRRPCFFVRVDYGLIKAAAAARSTHLTRNSSLGLPEMFDSHEGILRG
jgi:hypothetical protein